MTWINQSALESKFLYCWSWSRSGGPFWKLGKAELGRKACVWSHVARGGARAWGGHHLFCGEAPALGGTVGWRGCAGYWILTAEERAARGSSQASGRALQGGGLREGSVPLLSPAPARSLGRGADAELQLCPALGGELDSSWAAGAGTARLKSTWAMPANLTEGSPDSKDASGTAQTLDASPVLCTETVTFTEVVEGEQWGSFYYSFKVRFLLSTLKRILNNETSGI